MVHWMGLILPLAYLSILVGSLATFSNLYRKRKLARATSLEPWFPPHLQRNLYLSLLHLEPTPAPGKEKAPQVPESVLKAALLRRAIEDIHRILQIRNSKAALTTLQQRGSVGDDLFQRFTRAEQEAEMEIRDVVNEANAFAPNWGQTIFQSANEMAANIIVRQKTTEIQAQVEAEKAWWEQRKKTMKEEFMKELDGDVSKREKPREKVVPEKEIQRGGSDEDTVLVEGGGPGVPGGSVGGKSGSKKKKVKK